MKLRNLRPGAWEVIPQDRPSFVVVGDHVFELDDVGLAGRLLAQEDNFAPADDEAQALLDELIAERAGTSLADRVDDMKVADVLPLLETLGPDELAAVRDAEEAGKARQTILVRIDELTDAAAGGTNKEEA